MKLYAPAYYKNFNCIADKCRHSCCVGWEIDIDYETLRRYDSLSGEYGEKIQKSISREETPHFLLAENDRCPHLNECGLCEIIINLGEDHLSEICREHPRFYNTTSRGLEVGLGMSCEEAARIILNSDDYHVKTISEAIDTQKTDYDITPLRNTVYSIISDNSSKLQYRIKILEERFDIHPEDKSDAEWQDIFEALEYLDEKHKELFTSYSSYPQTNEALEAPLERALAYFVFRHCGRAESEYEFISALGLSILLTSLASSISEKLGICDTDALVEVCRIISEEIEYSEENTETLLLEF